MESRIDISSASPGAYAAVLGLEKYTRGAIDPTLLALVKVRASVLNGCSYCVDMHTRDAVAAGESTRRLFAVSAWGEAPFFSDKERAALDLTDSVTQLGQEGVPDAVWNRAAEFWSEKELLDLVVAIATINVWNRVAVSTRTQAPALELVS